MCSNASPLDADHDAVVHLIGPETHDAFQALRDLYPLDSEETTLSKAIILAEKILSLSATLSGAYGIVQLDMDGDPILDTLVELTLPSEGEN